MEVEFNKMSNLQFIIYAADRQNDRGIKKEIDTRIHRIIKRICTDNDLQGIRFDNELAVECADYEREYVDYVKMITYDPTTDFYMISNKNGQRIPFSYIEKPLTILANLVNHVADKIQNNA